MTERRPGIHYGEPAIDPAVQHAHEAPYAPPHEPVEFDREIQYHQLVWMGVSLLLLAVASGVLVFFLLRSFVSWRAAQAEPPPVAPPPAVVSGPQLLARPERELDQVRTDERQRLSSYGWVDPTGGVAHIPIERAIEIVTARGLPSRPAATAAGPATGAATTATTAAGTAGAEPHATASEEAPQ